MLFSSWFTVTKVILKEKNIRTSQVGEETPHNQTEFRIVKKRNGLDRLFFRRHMLA